MILASFVGNVNFQHKREWDENFSEMGSESKVTGYSLVGKFTGNAENFKLLYLSTPVT